MKKYIIYSFIVNLLSLITILFFRNFDIPNIAQTATYVMMCIPFISIKFIKNDEYSNSYNKFFYYYILYIMFITLSTFLFPEEINYFFIILCSVILAILIIMKFDDIRSNFTNLKSKATMIILYVILTLTTFYLRLSFTEEIHIIRDILYLGKNILSLFLTLLVSLPILMGEEYGFRYFLQDGISKYITPIKTTLFVIVVWFTFHIPLHIEQNYSLIDHIIFLFNIISKGLFFGRVWYKFKDLYLCCILHGVNNRIFMNLSSVYNYNIYDESKMLFIIFLINLFIFRRWLILLLHKIKIRRIGNR